MNIIKGTLYSAGFEWTKAMRDDKVTSGKTSPNKYGDNSNGEDFAVSVAEFTLNRDAFCKEFPKRAKILKRILDF